MLSCQQTQNVIDGKKRIILNPSEGQKRDFEAATFAEGEVYGIDILVASSEDGKVSTVSWSSHTVPQSLMLRLFPLTSRLVSKTPGRPSTSVIPPSPTNLK